MDQELAASLTEHPDRGLIALLDLSCDLEQRTSLTRLLERRNAATHRFVVTHQMLTEETADEWLDDIEWPAFVDQSISQLQIARAAVVYLVRAVDASEARTARLDSDRGIKRGFLPLYRIDPELNELD